MRKRTLSRMTALVLAAVLLLSGCGSKEEEKKTSTPSSSKAEQSSEVKEKAYWEMLDEVSDTSELPDWQGDTLEINLWFAAATYGELGDIPETDVVYKEFERVTGVKFNLDKSFDNGGNSIDAKMPMVVASKDYPTIVVGYNITTQLKELFEKGYLEDLTEYYEDGTLDQLLKYLPVEETMPYVYANHTTEDGRHFMIPAMVANNYDSIINVWDASGHTPEDYNASHYSTYGKSPRTASGQASTVAIHVREDILQAVMPEALTREEIEEIYMKNGEFTADEIFDVKLDSSEEFWDFLRDIKAEIDKGEYVGSDGRPVEVTFGPHTETDNWSLLVNLPVSVDLVPAGTDYFCFADYNAKDENSILQWAFSHDYYKNFMKEINALVREDIFAKNSFVDNAASYNEKLANSHYAVCYGVIFPEGLEYTYRPIFVNTEYNKNGVGAFPTTSFDCGFGVFKGNLSEEELDQLMHAVNYLNSEVGIKNFIWGPQSAGLFAEDAQGRRSFTNADLLAYYEDGDDNGSATKYGIYNGSGTNPTCRVFPLGVGYGIYRYDYLQKEFKDREKSDAWVYYTPGALEGGSQAENADYVITGCEVYGVGQSVKGIEKFWQVRNGFETDIKRLLVAESEEAFEKQFNEIVQFTKDNGLTDETLAEFNKFYVDANRDALKAIGLIK